MNVLSVLHPNTEVVGVMWELDIDVSDREIRDEIERRVRRLVHELDTAGNRSAA